MKKQVIVIHGADTFDTYEDYLKFLRNFEIDSLDYFKGKNWKISLQEGLGDEFEVISPRMPNKSNAKYLEWKIWFEKLVPLLNEEVILIGHSLGGTFLAKYLAENDLPKRITSLHIVAGAFDAEGTEESMGDFIVPLNLDNVSRQTEKILLYQSMDDVVVPPLNVEKFKKALPEAEVLMFENLGHFHQEEFSELVENIKNS